jgi:hypothetical protein
MVMVGHQNTGMNQDPIALMNPPKMIQKASEVPLYQKDWSLPLPVTPSDIPPDYINLAICLPNDLGQWGLQAIRCSERLAVLQFKYFHFRFDSAFKPVLLHL